MRAQICLCCANDRLIQPPTCEQWTCDLRAASSIPVARKRSTACPSKLGCRHPLPGSKIPIRFPLLSFGILFLRFTPLEIQERKYILSLNKKWILIVSLQIYWIRLYQEARFPLKSHDHFQWISLTFQINIEIFPWPYVQKQYCEYWGHFKLLLQNTVRC